MQTQSSNGADFHNSKLFTPVKLGAIALDHRIIMAPLTRLRTDMPGNIPNDMMAQYYGQRATKGGLIISEATVVSTNGHGYLGAPGIHTRAQMEGWKTITSAVHAKGGKIFSQLWHVGRQSHSDLQPDGGLPVGPSEVFHENFAITANGWVPVTQNRALTISEIHAIIKDFRKGAEHAKEAGFDGVELHAANSYLIDQFLQDISNKRTDHYGGPIENRVRFLLEALEGLVAVWGADRVGVRITPNGTWGNMGDSNPAALFGHVAERLNEYGLAYLHVVEPRILNNIEKEEAYVEPIAAGQLHRIFKGPILSAGGYTREDAEKILQKGDAAAVAFGRFFVSNPDLVERFRNGYPLNAYNRATFYGGNEEGYIDYPFYQSAVNA
ncbi:alkene reductase [Chitinophaga agrisoli]|uniref:Alkene reductase n=1 Tax=Chitinophaga agrisoli TaxID=2607653 RepID=A0A5B2VZM2_9BACT|nr:alkene reductase [Chitinophaga agrisoli]KAA2243499.1 alkene reductase [Chitinophaga agrisoli]